MRTGAPVIGTFIDAIGIDDATHRIADWGRARNSRYICLCNVHSAVTSRKDQDLSVALANADMVLPDGAPIAWVLRRKGYNGQKRVAGPDLMLHLCERLRTEDTGVFLFGANSSTLAILQKRLIELFPGITIRGALSPAYGDWSIEQKKQYIHLINESGAGIIFVALGCPKQEIWMSRIAGQVQGVMIGVGAAFDFHARSLVRAPEWVQTLGLEWLHRLLSEPRRLWKRYLVTNSLFVWYLLGDLLRGSLSRAH